VLFFIQWMGLATWTVPLTLVLNAHGYAAIQPLAFATGAVAAFVAPLFFGAMADRHMAPVRVLRRLAWGAAITLAGVGLAISWQWPGWAVLGLIQLYHLCSAPTTSVSTAITMAQMDAPKRQFGPVRALGTLGWMAGCLLISLLNADSSPRAAFCGAITWGGLAGFTLFLPAVTPPAAAGRLTWQQRLGLDAITLLQHPDHRVIFLCACLLNIPLAAFYPYTPPQLVELGLRKSAAWMSLSQITEIFIMILLGALLARWRLKWILLAGLGCALARYGLFMLNLKWGVITGIALHGCVYTLFFTTSQIYVNERVDPAWRTRAQALLTLMTSGAGYLIGYLACGWWFHWCGGPDATRWPEFWGALAVAVGGVTAYFLAAYRGRTRKHL